MSTRMDISLRARVEANFPLYTTSGKLTFSGALIRYFGDDRYADGAVSKGWSDETAREYLIDYINTVLPAIRRVGTEIAIESFTNEIIERIHDEIKNIRPKAEEQRLTHYYRLVSKTYLAAVNGEGFIQRAYPDDYEEGKSKAVKKRGTRLLLKKSFGMEEEIKLIKWIKKLDMEKAKGEDIGLMLMFLFGLRNGEACGLTFGDIQDLPNGMKAFYIKQTTAAGSKTVRIGGKTKNAFRVIPIYPFAFEILQKRKSYMSSILPSDDSAEKNFMKVEKLFIANGHNITDNLSASDLSAAGKKLFNIILGYDSESDKRIMALSEDFSSKLRDAGIDEKDPTTYLFRRNFATHLGNLGMESRQIQYLIGHDIEEEGYQRSYFSSGDELENICSIMAKHPFQFIYDNIHFEDGKSHHHLENTYSFKHPGETVFIQIIANETYDNVRIKSSFNGLKGAVFSIPHMVDIRKTVNINEAVYGVYADALARENRKEKTALAYGKETNG